MHTGVPKNPEQRGLILKTGRAVLPTMDTNVGRPGSPPRSLIPEVFWIRDEARSSVTAQRGVELKRC